MTSSPATRLTTPGRSPKSSLADVVVAELGDDAAEPRQLGERVGLLNVPAYSYRILYEINPGDDVVVLAVIHKRRDLRPQEVL